MNIHQEEEEESFVMTSLLAAAEEGNVDAIKELMESSAHFDVNLCNRVRLAAYQSKCNASTLCLIKKDPRNF